MEPLHWGELGEWSSFHQCEWGQTQELPGLTCLGSYTGIERTNVVVGYATERVLALPSVNARSRSGCATNSHFPSSMKKEEDCEGVCTPGASGPRMRQERWKNPMVGCLTTPSGVDQHQRPLS